ncbi:DUF3800 domain-containing protein [Anaerobranca gottschalkii]|uniref:DUF3800 domain-containing protein n=1 Tax=Anaerobranca gottschalkii DSM 13577 TaxID=1120990 RepID=A0A1H9Y4Q4_9FIRM|nr:DUF3800 domain-containing protein [Anaerobranca gottschalkii]SES63686.1 Protein of unknown function [Anaerobranca gottschalkii DSM 13577]
MYIAYFDESGDDGFPKYSSKLFVLTSIYMDVKAWKNNYNLLVNFRRQLKMNYNFPMKLEFHTKDFLTDKNPYRNYNWDFSTKKNILLEYFKCIAELDIKIINVVIVKPNILKNDYDVLDVAFSYNIQRIENDLCEKGNSNFLIITDEGRIGKMRKTSRRIQRYNLIPSKIFPGYYLNKEIKLLIEDPLPKDSKESYFLQVADLVAYIVYLYSSKTFINDNWANRVSNILNMNDIINFLKIIKECLNCKATSDNEFGIVNYPKNIK